MKEACMRRGFSAVSRQAAVFVVALGGVALAVPSVSAAHRLVTPSCSTYRTTPIRASENLTLHKNQCFRDSDGIIIKHSNITINLNGFALTSETGNHDGIDNAAGYDDVTVENGMVAGFQDGVVTKGATGGKITKVASSGNEGDGVWLDDNRGVTLSGDVLDANAGNGLVDMLSLDTITGGDADHNGGDGFYVDRPIVSGKAYWTVNGARANSNGRDGFQVANNSPVTEYQADLLNDTGDNNGAWGFYAFKEVVSRGNAAEYNHLGSCYHVRCN